ncbi:unnamed protein product [Clonostachys byssicola]|uniref:Uncharacterized protein n=1 Tax=Clonostachys byssicola TaxID=160290 RepID=A0A9N9Y8G2_9HYPO|nr:unnamed protein product [Clonostachys byssicola]
MVSIKQLSVISTLLFGLGQQVVADFSDDNGLVARGEDELEVRYGEDLEARGIDGDLSERGLPLYPRPPKIVVTPPPKPKRSLNRGYAPT